MHANTGVQLLGRHMIFLALSGARVSLLASCTRTQKDLLVSVRTYLVPVSVAVENNLTTVHNTTHSRRWTRKKKLGKPQFMARGRCANMYSTVRLARRLRCANPCATLWVSDSCHPLFGFISRFQVGFQVRGFRFSASLLIQNLSHTRYGSFLFVSLLLQVLKPS
jgi:hypothetical protein